jgi:pentatricopeptide repeat protein
VHCSKCGVENRQAARFCDGCGAALIGLAIPAAMTNGGGVRFSPDIAAADVTEGERKTVTALFADIKGSMELMEDLDPEAARAIVDPALKLMIDAVHRYDGYIVQSTGDGIFALFGAPQAQEDHPQRALYAALRMQEDMRRYGDRMLTQGQTPLQVRVGVNTGEVVVRSIQTGIDQTEYTPIGHSTGLAARLQTLATPGTTMISGSTRRLVEGFFQLKSFGPIHVKGVTEQVDVYEVTGLGPLRTRLQRAAARGLTKFVGRQREMDALKHAAEQAQTGHGQIVAVMAEAGVGKSRLFYEFKVTSRSGWMVLEAFSVSHGKASAYLPVLDLLSQYFEISRDDEDRKRRERVLGKVLGLDRMLEDTLPYLYSLQGIAENSDLLAQMDPQIRRRRTLEAIKRIILRESLNQPLIIIFEDLHWIDSDTQALLNLLVDAIANARVLLLVNYRPEYRHDWGSRTHYTQLRLDALDRENSAEMLSAQLGDEAELEPLKRLITNKTDGNPFFIEEIVQALFEQGVIARNGRVKLMQPLTGIRIPPTVQAVLASRIDRLPPQQKELLQTLAVVGRRFVLGLVLRLASGSEADVDRLLGYLQSGEFIYEEPALPDPEYSFKHALTQEVVYDSMLIEHRRQLHRQTAAAIESLFSDTISDHLEDLTRHYSRAADADKASKYLGLAAEQSLRRSAYSEAQTHLSAALTLLPDIPDDRERADRELRLQLALGSLLTVTQSFDSAERNNAYERARELCQRLSDTKELFHVLWHLCQSKIQMTGGLAQGLELAEEALRLAGHTQEPEQLIAGYYNLGETLWRLGRPREASAHLRQALDLYDPRHHQPLAAVYGVDLRVLCLWLLGLVEHELGLIDQAGARLEAAVQYARELGHIYSLGFAMMGAAWVEHLGGKPQVQQEIAHSGLVLAVEHGFAEMSCWMRGLEGHALFAQGRCDEGISELDEALRDYHVLGASANLAVLFDMLIDGYTNLGRIDEARELLVEALRKTQPWSEPELLRLRGNLFLAQAVAVRGEAESSFRQSIELSRQHETKLHELRATMSLARLLASQKRMDEARAMLAEIYGWFTEGFDSADLKDAKALLDELS